MLTALGPDAEVSAARLPEVCLAAAARSLDRLLAEGRFGRDSALGLLAIDALTTYAYEHASSAPDGPELSGLARQGGMMMDRLLAQRV
jgi:hypothetical protein